MRHKSGEARRAETAIVDCAADGLVEVFQVVGVRCRQGWILSRTGSGWPEQGNSVPYAEPDCYGVTNSIEVSG